MKLSRKIFNIEVEILLFKSTFLTLGTKRILYLLDLIFYGKPK